VLFTKVKGLVLTNGTVYDPGDLVVPPTENNALFVATKVLNTIQSENGQCPDPEANCTTDQNCHAGTQTSNGFVLPICNVTVGRCLITGWCPVENESLPYLQFIGIDKWTILMRTNVVYPVFGLTANDANQLIIKNISQMLPDQNWTQIYTNGTTVNVQIDWSCNLDLGADKCRPAHSFSRIDTVGMASSGFNYRRAIYFNQNLTLDTPPTQIFPQRVYTKLYGIRFIFHITGTGRKFDFATTVITIGSGLAFLGIATIATDFFLQYLHPKKSLFDHAKREPVDLQEIGEGTKLLSVEQ